MPQIPSSVNGVLIEFGATVNKNVDQKVIDALKHCIKPNITKGYALTKIYISSANDSHKKPSRHVQGLGKAVDISRINSLKMSLHYKTNKTNKTVTEVTNSIQTAFESFSNRRENFGPMFKKKLGVVYKVSGHSDHIHLSVN